MIFVLLGLFALIAFVPLIYVIAQYNQLVNLRKHIDNAWSNIDTELKRRYDLIPNLVATVKGYTDHEKEILERVTELRAQCAANTGAHAEQARDEQQLVSALQRLLVVVENYPELKADEHYLELQQELIQTENRIQAARRFYNGNIRDYQVKCESFPSNMVAAMFGFESRDYFNVESSVRELPEISFE